MHCSAETELFICLLLGGGGGGNLKTKKKETPPQLAKHFFLHAVAEGPRAPALALAWLCRQSPAGSERLPGRLR